MTLAQADFDEFFAALHDGAQPFAWQRRLLDEVLDGGSWPDAVVAPTGSGKTATIDVHVFALAIAVASGMPLPPRRLAMIVDRRVLVDDQYSYAQYLAERLATSDGSSVLKQVAEALWRLRDDRQSAGPGDSPLLVARLRGGLPPSRRWADQPTAAVVLCATPEMWGSRLLFRGYGSSFRAWPREAGLLAVDTVAVVDEAHLARQLLCTARRVGELVGVAERKWEGPPALQVVETTATPGDVVGTTIGVDNDDLTCSDVLEARLRRPKPVSLIRSRDWGVQARRQRYADELADATVDLLRSADSGTVGCFVNTVGNAVRVWTALRRRELAGRPLVAVLVCGQVRPIDLERLSARYDGLLTPNGNSTVDVIVSTQSLEVGVDIDLAGMVTELASGSAVAQRAGRVNRRGLRPAGSVVVMTPVNSVKAGVRSGPYADVELNEALAWIERRADDPKGLAPWTLRDDPPPSAEPTRTLFQRPELGQVWQWARTSDDLVAEPELELWLSDDLDPDFTVGVVVRRELPDDDGEAEELIRALRPRRHEIFGVPIRTARAALLAAEPLRRCVLVRGDEVTALEWRRTNDGFEPRIRPGDIVVVDAEYALFTAQPSDDHRTPQVLAAADDGVERYPADDVLETPAELRGDDGLSPGEVVHRIELDLERESARPGISELADLLTFSSQDGEGERGDEERAAVTAWLDDHQDTAMARAAATLLRTGNPKTVDVVVQRDADGLPVRVLIVDRRRASTDEATRQVWTPGNRTVRLEAHQNAVADRVVGLAKRVGLTEELTAALRVAALHHDDGKADPRFQILLGGNASTPLAKSRLSDRPEAISRRRERAGLPRRWRHEQRSVIDVWEANLPSDIDRELVARLVGTTHGHGRAVFPHTGEQLLHPNDDQSRDVARELFDEGAWDELIERTQFRYGAWGCAYLEAILRAADGQVSSEGR